MISKLIVILRCASKGKVHFLSLCMVLLLVVLHCVGTETGNTTEYSNTCSGSCDFDSHPLLSHCGDSGNCFERAYHGNHPIEVFTDVDEAVCDRVKNPTFPASIGNVSAQILKKTLSVNISWEWPAINDFKESDDYKISWALQYVITVPGEHKSACYSVSLSKEYIHQGKLTIPCMKFRDDGFPAMEFKITFLAFTVERYKSSTLLTPSRLQEITISKADKLTDAFVSVWNPQMTYQIANRVLTVSFVPAPLPSKYASYDVQVFKALDSKCIPGAPYVDKINVVPSWPMTSVSFSTENYEECAKYCVSVHPVRNSSENLCSEGCVKEMHDMVLFHVPPRILECRKWNASFSVKVDPIQSEISVSFNVCCGYDHCFEKFFMVLWSPTKNVCTSPLRRIADKTFYWNSAVSVINFKNLAPGNYCVRVSPVYPPCKNTCYVLRSRVYNLVEPYVLPLDMKVPDSPVVNRVLLISILSVIGVIVLVILVGILWRKSRPPPKVEIDVRGTYRTESSELLSAPPSGSPREVVISKLLLNATHSSAQRDVAMNELLSSAHSSAQKELVFLYTHDTLTRNRVRALSNFLKHCGNFKVILDEDHLAQITVEHSCFISEVVKYNCPENGVHSCYSDNRRIIIVESKRAVKLLKKKKAIMRAALKLHPIENKNCDICKFAHTSNEAQNGNDEILSSDDEEQLPNTYENLDKFFFCLGMSHITSTRRRFVDDCHIFVVQFSDFMLPESETFMDQFPGSRYCLPRQLGDLCLNLDRIDHPKDLLRLTKINEMQEVWENNESYKKLLAVCHQSHS